jgi:hypothetical protein
MVDYSSALPQLQMYQAPNVLALAQQANQMQLHRAQLAEVQRAAQEQNQLRSLLESGVDRNSPDFLKQVYRISPTMGMTLEKGQAELQNAGLTQKKLQGELAAQPVALEKSRLDAAAQAMTFHRDLLPTINDQVTYDVWRANTIKDLPGYDSQIPKVFTPEVKIQLMSDAAKALAEYNLQARFQFQTVKNADGSETLVRVAPGAGPATPVPGGTGAPKPGEPYQDTSGRRYQPIKNAQGEITGYREITPGAVAPAAAPAAAAPAAAPAAAAPAAGVPAAVAMQPAAANGGYLAGLDRAEGRGKNKNSTATGKYQFLDNTFVGTAKKVFPELADKSAKEILALRGTKLQDGSQIEDALERRFRADNIASLASAGIQPTPGNTYLAHFLGAGGARSVLGADPSTPVSSLLSADAIAANKSVLEGKTAGEVAAWAANKFGNQPGLAASMTASNARLGGAPAGFVPAGGAPMSLGAPTVNNALMANMFGAAPPQNAMLSLQPQIPGALTPPTAQAPVTAPAAVTPPVPAVAPSATANMSPAARAEYDKKMADAAAAQETAKANKKEVGEYILRTIGGEGGKKIEDLISASTSGKVQKWGAETVGAFGTATPGMENIGKLGTIAKQMTFDLLNGKLGAGISNDDRTFVAGLVADIANPDVPANERIAGFRQLKNTMSAWASGKEVEIGAPAVAPESGVPRGRRGALNAATPPKASSSSAKAPAGVPQNVWDVMTPEERALF